MSKLTAAYVAGLIDGEGCLEIQKKNRKYEVRLRICMTDKKIINWLYDSFGGFYGERKGKGNAKDSYTWTIKNNKRVKPFLDKVGPYLRVKRRHLEVIRIFQKTFKKDSYYEVETKLGYGTGKHKEIKESVLKERDNLHKRIRVLNKRGILAA